MKPKRPPKTEAVIFPFDLFGGGGCGAGADAIHEALGEILADNREETTATRADAYTEHIRLTRVPFDEMSACENWRRLGRDAALQAFNRDGLVLWIAGSHLGVLPVYETLGARARQTLVIQLDGHLDIQNFADSNPQPTHGNFLLHGDGPLPEVINIGHRDLLLEPNHIARTYAGAYSAEMLVTETEVALRQIQERADAAANVFLDIDCDVFDPGVFPAVAEPVPFGLDAAMVLRVLNAVWSERVSGMAISEYCPASDLGDRCLAMVMWLVEWVLLKQHEIGASQTASRRVR
jgi:arginase family enzyme